MKDLRALGYTDKLCMNRRKFISLAGAAAIGSTAGCISDGPRPPRRSNVFDEIEVTNGRIDVELEGELSVSTLTESDDDGFSLPIGAASAQKGSRGATGRGQGGYVGAPKTDKGRAKWRATDDYDRWYRQNRNRYVMTPAAPSLLGISYLATYEVDPPEYAPVNWDREFDNPIAGQGVAVDIEEISPSGEGWYRTGLKMVNTRNASVKNLRWEYVDFEVVQDSDGSYEVGKEWKVSSRIY